MSVYTTIIIEGCGCPPERADEVEDFMRHTIFQSTLNWQTRAQLQDAAREAWECIQYMETPEGIAYIESLQHA